jgi:hypothetical protein
MFILEEKLRRDSTDSKSETRYNTFVDESF